jgi:PHD/YefM family antitoxin component YafN of YafNO toxin-antitoxin module
MSEQSTDDLVRILREHGARYVVGATGQPVAVLLTLEEYDHYLDLLDDEADSQDPELATRLNQAAARTTDVERSSFHDYLSQRLTS